MSEDWRVTVELEGGASSTPLVSALHARQVDSETRLRLGERVAVSGAGATVFLYADTEVAAREAELVVRQLVTASGLAARFKLERWHHAEEAWEDPSRSLPSTPHELTAEHTVLEAQEARDSRSTGIAEWELRLEFASHHDARMFAERLGHEQFTHVVRRFHYLLVGAVDEDDANEWALRLKAELPPGATIHVEPGSGLAWRYMPANLFAVMGGLAG